MPHLPLLLGKRTQTNTNRKCQDYVYVKVEYRTTMLKVKPYLRPEKKVMNTKYCHIVRRSEYKSQNNEKVVLHYAKLTNPLSFQFRFPKSVPTYRMQVANQRHQTP